jgi:hypothetical protein
MNRVRPVLYDYTRRNLSRQVLAEMLDKLDWDLFFTGTFKDSFRRDAAIKSFYRWLNSVCWLKGIDLDKKGYAWFLEWHKWRDVPHIHALLRLPGLRTNDKLRSLWRPWFVHYGRCQVERYNEEMGAGFYLSKYMVKDTFGRGDWDIEYPKQL